MIRLASSFCLTALLVLAACDAGPKTSATASASTTKTEAPAAPTGQTFGAGVKLTSSMNVATLLADPKAHVGHSVRVEGMIVDVCPKRGCWMDLAGEAPGQKVRFKVTDGEMVFPVDAKGKYAVVEGVVAVNELSLEETKEYVAYQQREYGAERDPATVTEPMSIVRLDGTGAVVRDKK